jgi:peptidoglycan hydrolase-like protein with peptidoglycan-binding domain
MAAFLTRALDLPTRQAAPPLTMLRPGDSGPQVALLQETLRALHLYRGPEDGTFDETLGSAVVAFHKLFGRERTDVWNRSDWNLVGEDKFAAPKMRPGEPNRIEVDIGRQLLFLIRDEEVAAIMPVSTGSGAAYINSRGDLVRGGTPRGDMTLIRFRPGWIHTYLGSIYNPWNFTSAYAIHGFRSVPTLPASHGCVRVHLWDSDWLTDQLWQGMPIHIWDR